ncbi:MAG: DMT family transporter [Spirochaetota bacterium]
MKQQSFKSISLKGALLLLLSAMAFALSTVFAKVVTTNSTVPGIEITFVRFSVGLIFTGLYLLSRKIPIWPNNPRLVILRAVTNTAAVLFFFTGIQFTTVTNANMLNMTYPVFVFLIAPYFNREANRKKNYIFLFLTIIGVYLIVVPDFKSINPGDISALMSGVCAGMAISALREARKYDNSFVILFYLMFIGIFINAGILIPLFVMPDLYIFIFMLLSAVTAVAGQVLLTVGYRFIDAAPGSLISASRILFAGILGFSIFGDPLTLRILSGGILILIALTGVSGIVRFLRASTPPGSSQ